MAASAYRVAVYIDGFNLYFGLKQGKLRKFYWLNVEALAEKLLLADQRLVLVRYFTADIRGTGKKRSRQQTFLKALDAHCAKLEIVKGHYLEKKHTCPNCNYKHKVPEEKQTDVNIATYLLADAMRDVYDTAVIVSGDSDLAPPIEMVKQLFPKKRVVVAFPPGRRSAELKRVAHGAFAIDRKRLKGCLLPDPVITKSGHKLRKPSKWK